MTIGSIIIIFFELAVVRIGRSCKLSTHGSQSSATIDTAEYLAV